MFYQYSHAGSYHTAHHIRNQDCIQSCENNQFAVITLADGVSSCERSAEGAQTACRFMTELLSEKGGFFLEFEEEKRAELALGHVLYHLNRQARDQNQPVEVFSSTLSSVLIDKESNRLLSFNLGDSLIIGTSENQCPVISAPDDSRFGCCVTTTDIAPSRMRSSVRDIGSLSSVIICSDGAWKLMFSGNTLRKDVRNILQNRDYDGLSAFLESQQGFDDCSYVAVDIDQLFGRNT